MRRAGKWVLLLVRHTTHEFAVSGPIGGDRWLPSIGERSRGGPVAEGLKRRKGVGSE